METDFLFKIVVIGDSGVGKSCLINQYINGTFHNTYISTIGVDFFVKEKTVDDKRVKLQIWDTAGQERFRTITYSYYRHADAVILVYDVTNLETLNNLDHWMSEIRRFISEHVPIILIANKIDLVKDSVTSTLDGQKVATKYNLSFFELSALDRDKIDMTMSYLTSKMINKRSERSNILDDKDTVRVSSSDVASRGRCC